MNRITDMLTVCIAEIVYLGCLFFAQNTWIVMALCGFCLLEVGMHTFFGVTMYRRFKDRGKKTIYNPGFASAYLGFGVIAIMMIQNVIASGVTGYDWVKTIIMLILMGLIEILLPERLFRNHNTSYGYASAKYFTKFLK
ncbi:HXXEE domain-containing protein [Secundilactobacillus collinoides]|nr:HXXEE domain-containing protein [Secundilactobacillus collinoides]